MDSEIYNLINTEYNFISIADKEAIKKIRISTAIYNGEILNKLTFSYIYEFIVKDLWKKYKEQILMSDKFNKNIKLKGSFGSCCVVDLSDGYELYINLSAKYLINNIKNFLQEFPNNELLLKFEI